MIKNLFFFKKHRLLVTLLIALLTSLSWISAARAQEVDPLSREAYIYNPPEGLYDETNRVANDPNFSSLIQKKQNQIQVDDFKKKKYSDLDQQLNFSSTTRFLATLAGIIGIKGALQAPLNDPLYPLYTVLDFISGYTFIPSTIITWSAFSNPSVNPYIDPMIPYKIGSIKEKRFLSPHICTLAEDEFKADRLSQAHTPAVIELVELVLNLPTQTKPIEYESTRLESTLVHSNNGQGAQT